MVPPMVSVRDSTATSSFTQVYLPSASRVVMKTSSALAW